MKLPPRIAGTFILMLGSVLGLTSACSKTTRPYNHPTMGVYDRNASRIQLVPLIIQDEKRAAIVQAKYIEIEQLTLAREAERKATLSLLNCYSSSYQLEEEKIRTEIERFSRDGGTAYKKYVQLQMDIRQHTTREEFEKLDKAR